MQPRPPKPRPAWAKQIVSPVIEDIAPQVAKRAKKPKTITLIEKRRVTFSEILPGIFVSADKRILLQD